MFLILLKNYSLQRFIVNPRLSRLLAVYKRLTQVKVALTGGNFLFWKKLFFNLHPLYFI